jgi:hypothetical protein
VQRAIAAVARPAMRIRVAASAMPKIVASRLALGAVLLASLLGSCLAVKLVLSEQEEAFAAAEAALKAAAKASGDSMKGAGPKGQDLNQEPLGIPSDKMTPEQKLIDWVIRDRGVVSAPWRFQHPASSRSA